MLAEVRLFLETTEALTVGFASEKATRLRLATTTTSGETKLSTEAALPTQLEELAVVGREVPGERAARK